VFGNGACEGAAAGVDPREHRTVEHARRLQPRQGHGHLRSRLQLSAPAPTSHDMFMAEPCQKDMTSHISCSFEIHLEQANLKNKICVCVCVCGWVGGGEDDQHNTCPNATR
jgi:hypothetical protein